MSATKTFAPVPVPDAIAKMAAAAPGGAAVQPQPAQAAPAQDVAAAPVEQPAPAATPALKLPVREASQTMSLKVPKSLYDELRNFAKLTDIPMSEVLVEGARKELASLKKKYGLEG
ncbi:TPA: hypothetical protein QDB21_005624 [Burkholderia vietnamiensis]|nr:hypothetical protein [Burkholderia vietnamiensis]